MSLLYPQLKAPVAEDIANERSRLPIDDLMRCASTDHPEAFFTPTGGVRVTERQLRTLRDKVVSIASEYGYPNPGDNRSLGVFDTRVTVCLYEMMNLEPAEAAKDGVWSFMTCGLLCDIVRWRFFGHGETALERYLPGRRNAFERLWWRGYILRDDELDEPFRYVSELGEDELVQIMERPFLAGNASLSRTIAKQLSSFSEDYPTISRRVLIRESQKRLRRLAAFVAFEALPVTILDGLVAGVFQQVVDASNRKRRSAVSL